ncbi:YhgE/Pip domain-containing protein [Clostridium sp. 1001271B_151109_B4]|uniref:YhgE/Pip domain-containing protein n=1 Tax=Clostridium sp. 1001271B_151109_B4 TaxID=2787148 RepID=UPI0018A90567|nr:YhgE/Pip domain-containing protein [Clostridium sp. 1001271B_151109_B4]
MKKIFKVFQGDIKKLIKSPVAIIIVTGLCILPSLYAWINIKACWDPYSNTGNLPIVVVNNDEGTDLNGEYINVGDEVVNNLKENKSIGWVFKDGWQANDGLNKGEYYALIEIPNNFTEGLISITTTAPRKPQIIYKANEKANAIATKIADVAKDSVVREIKTNFVDTVNETSIKVINELADKLQINKPQILSLKETMVSATEDLDKVSEYITNTAEQSKEFQDYLKKMQSDLPKITDGINNLQNIVEVSKNVTQYTNNIVNLTSSNIDSDIIKIQAANNDIKNLINTIKQDIKNDNKENILESLNKISDLNNKAIAFLDEDIKILQTIYDYAGSDIILQQINLLSSIRDTFENREQLIESLASAIENNEATENINELLDSLSSAVDDMSSYLSEASNFYYSSVVNVFDNLTNGSALKLDTIENILESTKIIVPELKALSNFMISTNSLSVNQINELNDKVISLNDKLNDLNEETKEFTSDTIDEMVTFMLKNPDEIASFISSPIELKEEEVYDSGIFGVGLTPFYSVLAIWIGALLACCLLSVECEEKFKIQLKLNTFQEHFGKLLLFLAISLIQSFIIVLGDIYILGVNPESMKVLFIFTILASITFTVIIFTLVSLLGNVGKAIVVIMMVFQIAGAGGIYPIQTNPEIFGILEPLWPFTYAINGFREGISGALESHVKSYVLALIGFIGVFLALSIVKRPFHKLSSMMDHKFRESGM